MLETVVSWVLAALAVYLVCGVLFAVPFVTSGVRLGTPAGTTRGFGEPEFRQIADWITEVIEGLAANGEDGNGAVEARVRAEVGALCARFPIYPGF